MGVMFLNMFLKGRSWSKPCSAGNGSGFSDIVVETGMSNVLTYVSKYHSSLKGIKALWIKGHSSASAGKVQN